MILPVTQVSVVLNGLPPPRGTRLGLTERGDPLAPRLLHPRLLPSTTQVQVATAPSHSSPSGDDILTLAEKD